MWAVADQLAASVNPAKVSDVMYLDSPSVDVSMTLNLGEKPRSKWKDAARKVRKEAKTVAQARRAAKFQREKLEQVNRDADKRAHQRPSAQALLPWVQKAVREDEKDGDASEIKEVLSELETFYETLPDGGPKPEPKRKRPRKEDFLETSTQRNALWLAASDTRKSGACMSNLTAGTTADPLGVGGFRQGFFGANPSGNDFVSRSFGAQEMESTKLSLDPARNTTIWQQIIHDKDRGRWSRPPAKIDLSKGDTRSSGAIGSTLGHTEHTLCKFRSDHPSTQKVSAVRLKACRKGVDRNLAPDAYNVRLENTTFHNATGGSSERLLKIAPPITKNLQDTYTMPAYMNMRMFNRDYNSMKYGVVHHQPQLYQPRQNRSLMDVLPPNRIPAKTSNMPAPVPRAYPSSMIAKSDR